MAYYGERYDVHGGLPIYQAYVEKLKKFVVWLLQEGYSVRFLTGDIENDRKPADEVIGFIRQSGKPGWQNCVVAESISSVQELTDQILKTDIVIASRFHNLIAAMM